MKRSEAGRLPVAMAALVAVAGGCAPAAATEQGARIRDLYQLFLGIGIGVAVLIWVLVTWSIIRYRHRSDRPRQTRNNIPLEVAWTVAPAILLVGLFILTLRTQIAVDTVAAEPAVSVRVTGFTWQWRFEYEDTPVTITGTADQPPEMVVPVGETIHVDLVSADVVHSFYVPTFLFKRDAIPGRETSFDFKATSPGVYPGQCAEFCGIGHSVMTFTVRAVDRATFDAWLAGGWRASSPPSSSPVTP